jgi:hypothetical protein
MYSNCTFAGEVVGSVATAPRARQFLLSTKFSTSIPLDLVAVVFFLHR